MKRIFRRLTALLVALSLLLLSGCHPMVDDSLDTKYISATFYPLYALAANILDGVPALSLTCLTQPQDGCLRSYSLSDWDESTLLYQDVVILGGCGLESFESDLQQLANQPILLTALNSAHLRTETAGDADDENNHLVGQNPWSFLSVAGAMEICIAIAGGMQEMDAAYASIYAENLENYLERLDALIVQLSDVLAPAPYRKVAVFHEGLTYFAAQFSLDVSLAYAREPGTDLIDNDLEALLTELKASGTQVVFLEKQAPQHLVHALEEAGYAVALLDTLTGHAADGDLTAYERIMLENAHAAAAALEKAR